MVETLANTLDGEPTKTKSQAISSLAASLTLRCWADGDNWDDLVSLVVDRFDRSTQRKCDLASGVRDQIVDRLDSILEAAAPEDALPEGADTCEECARRCSPGRPLHRHSVNGSTESRQYCWRSGGCGNVPPACLLCN